MGFGFVQLFQVEDCTIKIIHITVIQIIFMFLGPKTLTWLSLTQYKFYIESQSEKIILDDTGLNYDSCSHTKYPFLPKWKFIGSAPLFEEQSTFLMQ